MVELGVSDERDPLEPLMAAVEAYGVTMVRVTPFLLDASRVALVDQMLDDAKAAVRLKVQQFGEWREAVKGRQMYASTSLPAYIPGPLTLRAQGLHAWTDEVERSLRAYFGERE